MACCVRRMSGAVTLAVVVPFSGSRLYSATRRSRTMATKYRVVQVKGAKPETFIVVGIDFDAGAITSTSESMQEKEMRGCLEKAGASKKDIEAWIEQARKYPG